MIKIAFNFRIKKKDNEGDIVDIYIDMIATKNYLTNLALEIGYNKIADLISKCHFDVISDDHDASVTDYVLNVRPNPNEFATDFWKQVVLKMCSDSDGCLVVQLSDSSIYRATNFTEDNSVTCARNYTNVTIESGGKTMNLNRTFTSEDAVLFKYKNDRLLRLLRKVSEENEIGWTAAIKGVKSKLPKYKLTLPGGGTLIDRETGKPMTGNEYSEKVKKELTSDDLRVIIQSNGIDISAIDSKCTLTSQDIKALKDEVFTNTAIALGIPKSVFYGEVTEKSDGADAIHPGFGFLSENSKFAELCEQCNITFIGPDSKVIASLGNKQVARNTMMAAGVPVIPGSKEPVYDAKTGAALAQEIGYPVIIKSALGGGGKGMRTAWTPEEFESAFQTAQKETEMAFADSTMYIEHFVENPRHIEFQILADKYGNVIHLGERDCSIQRNHQKLIEESPSVALSDELRKKMGDAAVKAAKAAGYENAGTIEFLLEKSGNFYFMEMNTRIQVEHPVTEWVTGVDLVKEQIRIASGQKLSYTQEDIKLTGHAIECRINAENPEKGFRPSPGTITDMYLPGGKGIRIDSAIYSGYTIPPYYDSMVAKLIVWAKNRQEAIHKMQSALGEVIIEGIDTNVDYQYGIVNHPDYIEGNIDIEFIERL